MLARAAKRKLKPQTPSSRQLAAAYNRLYLPWLCPAQVRWIASTSLSSQSQPRDAVRHNHSPPVASHKVTRSLATATDFFNPSGDPIPFLSPHPGRNLPSNSSSAPISILRSWNPSSTIVIHDAIASASPLVKKNQVGIGGDSAELHQNLHACLSVGRFDRAEAIVRRLAQLFKPTAIELLEAHHSYLRSLLDSLILGRKDVSLKKIQKWFEVEVRGKGVPPNSTTFALLCRAAMATLSGHTRDRTVRRYLHLSEEAGLLDATISSGEYHEIEWQELFSLRDDLFPQPDVEIQMSEMPEVNHVQDSLVFTTGTQFEPIDLHVKPVEQKGLGLKSLKDSLVTLDNVDSIPYPHEMEGTKEEKDRAWATARQLRVEEDVVDAAIARWREEHAHMLKMGINPVLQTKSMETVMWQWHTAMESAVRQELEEINKVLENENEHEGSPRLEYGPFLESVKPEKVAAITILATLQHLMGSGIKEGIKVGHLTSKIGGYLESETSTTQRNHKKGLDARNSAYQRRSQVVQRLTKRHDQNQPQASSVLPALDETHQMWPSATKVQLGALLLAKLVDVAKIQVRQEEDRNTKGVMSMESALKHTFEYDRGKLIGKIHAHPVLVERLSKEPLRTTIGMAGQLPMLTEPLPWTGFRKGGYLRYPAVAMRQKGFDHVQEMYAVAAIERGDMDQVFAGLDVLSKTAWRINNNVLKVMLEAWNTGEAIADIPPENPEMTYPPEPDASANGSTRLKWRRQIQELENKKAGFHSQRCFQNLQLEVARAFSNQTFYYPHNIDFRGRAYPIPPYLNHMGADNARGLLMFAKGKPLGATGFSWLKVHLANVFGFDKANLSERESFTMEHIDDIFDSASNPLTGNKWWLKAEDPWQCLAACFEIKAALESPDPTKFVSHLAIHQDGTCNGLQHYAALGGDSLGAAQVNLEPGDRPADIYSGVAKLVKEEIEKEVKEGHPMAKVLAGKITRKVVKQTVMTNVYGVTFVGARSQVQRQLDDIMPNMSECDIDNYVLSSYIAKKIFKALAAMFQGAHAIQYWLGECADKISTAITPEQVAQIQAWREFKGAQKDPKYKDEAIKYTNKRKLKTTGAEFRSSVVWTTPLKLPVVQPYRAPKTREIETVMQRISLREPKPGDPISKRKQLQAFPPNFIHSLDATHMLLSALKCDEIGLTFASVHDSFWTHAADVPVMNRVLRDAFVRMHSEDIIGRLAAEFKARYKDSLQLATVYAHSPVGKHVLAFRKKQAKEKRIARKTTMDKSSRSGGYVVDELLEEWERQRLLKSDDAKERERGEKMVTPASIFESVKMPAEFQPLPKDISEITLGAIPEGMSDNASGEDGVQAKLPVKPTEADESSAGSAQDIVDPSELRSNVHGAICAEVEGLPIPQKLAAKAEKKPIEKKVLIWVPLAFPDVPKKGDFDVSRLKDSTYFFS